MDSKKAVGGKPAVAKPSAAAKPAKPPKPPKTLPDIIAWWCVAILYLVYAKALFLYFYPALVVYLGVYLLVRLLGSLALPFFSGLPEGPREFMGRPLGEPPAVEWEAVDEPAAEDEIVLEPEDYCWWQPRRLPAI